MTDYELNVAVAIAMGYELRGSDTRSNAVFITDNDSIKPFNPCNVAEDYMKIIIKYNIDISFYGDNVLLYYLLIKDDFEGQKGLSRFTSDERPKEYLGTLICELVIAEFPNLAEGGGVNSVRR